MSGLYFLAIAAHPSYAQDPRITRKTRQDKPSILVLRVWGSVLFCLMLLVFPIRAVAVDLTLAWDPNTEPDLEGYGIYFKQGSPGPPYDLFGYVALSELTDPENPDFTLTDLQTGSRYYISLTAYDTAGNESSYADPVCTEIGEQIVLCGSASGGGGSGTGTGGSSGGNSGGGAGCFIETSLTHPKPQATMAALLFFGAVLFMGARVKLGN
jgi:hypothetical protein